MVLINSCLYRNNYSNKQIDQLSRFYSELLKNKENRNWGCQFHEDNVFRIESFKHFRTFRSSFLLSLIFYKSDFLRFVSDHIYSLKG
ncbi:MAG: hypothetical protein ACOC2U_02895 [bacterium]